MTKDRGRLARYACAGGDIPPVRPGAPWLVLVAVFTLLAMPLAAAPPPTQLLWQGSIEIASGRGEKGPWEQNASRYHYVDDPSVTYAGGEDAGVVWVNQSEKDVFFQRFSREGRAQLSAPVNVSRSPATFSWLPRVVTSPHVKGSIYVLWQEIIFSGGSHGGDILFARSEDHGNSFSPPHNLSNSVGGDGKGRINAEVWHNGSLDLAVGSDGSIYAAWTEYDGPLWFSRSTDGGASFSPPQQVAGGPHEKPARAPSLALGPNHEIYLAWTTGEDDAADIHLTSSTDRGGSFLPPRPVAPTPTYSDAPKLAVDRAGRVHLVYAESEGGPFEHSHIRYTRSSDGAQSFDAPRRLSHPLPKQVKGAAYPYLALDAQDHVYVAWELFRGQSRSPRGLGFTLSRDGGDQFVQPAPIPGSSDPGGGQNGSQQGLLMKKLAVDGLGKIAVVNSSFKPNAYSRVWLVRGEAIASGKRD